MPEVRGKEMVIDTRNRSESKPHEKPRGVLALMQMAIWILFRHNRTFIIQLSSSEMINDERDFISKKVTSFLGDRITTNNISEEKST
jgi:hypothetical protein